MLFKNKVQKSNSDNDFESIVQNCEGYLDNNSPKLYPKTISDKIYNFKKDFANHDYANVNYDKSKVNIDKNNINIDKSKLNNGKSNLNIDKDYEHVNIDFNRRNKNDILRQQFFQSDNIDKNDINDKFNRFNGKKIECHSIVNDVTKSGPDVKVSGSLNMKLLINPERYNRVLTTTESFMETAEASFTKNQISKLRSDGFENFVKKSERYYTSETGDRQTDVLNNTVEPKGKTEIRIFYNPTFKTTLGNLKGFCIYCKRKCPRTEEKCCSKCECLEIELATIWKENWLNILCLLSIVFMFIALLIQWVLPQDVCGDRNSTDVNDKCFEMM